MNTYKKGFGARIAAIRVGTGLSMTSFARAVLSPGASAKNIGRIEAEEVQPRAATIAKLAATGGVTPEWLTQGKYDTKPGTTVRAVGVGQRIEAARKAKGLTALALAKAAGMGATAQNVRRLETGSHAPTMSTLTKLADVLGMPVTKLAFGA